MRGVLIAGVLSGLLGSGGAFVAGRYAGPTPPEKPAVDPAARKLAGELLDKLKSGDAEQFATALYANTYAFPDAERVVLQAGVVKAREQHAKSHGKSSGEFEPLREQVVGPSVVRLVYLEKFERGGVAWYFVLCRGSDGWRVADVKWDPTLGAAFSGFE
jgi:hypothetical protein